MNVARPARPLDISVDRDFSLHGDKQMLMKIVADMFANGGRLAPADHWLSVSQINGQQGSFDETAFDSHFAKLDQLLDPWLGCTGMKAVDEAIWSDYRDYLPEIDFLGLLPARDFQTLSEKNWISADLGTVMDINLISTFARFPVNRPPRILEVGGGYGRLADAFHRVRQNNVKYVLVDAVPASLLYAHIYMSRCPDVRVGFYYNDDPLDFDRFDCYVVPAWHFERINSYVYDLTINVESLQETCQDHVDYYIGLFDRLTALGGTIYLSNAHDYVFKGSWPYPDHWRRLYMHNTPRSWSPHHPTEIFRKGDRDFTEENKLQTLAYNNELASRAKIKELEAALSAKDAEYWDAQRQVLELWARVRELVEKG